MPLRSVVPGQEGFILQEVWGVGQLGWGGDPSVSENAKEGNTPRDDFKCSWQENTGGPGGPTARRNKRGLVCGHSSMPVSSEPVVSSEPAARSPAASRACVSGWP